MKLSKIMIVSAVAAGILGAAPLMAQEKKSSWGFGLGGSDKTKKGDLKKKVAPSRVPWLVNCASNGAAVNCATTQRLVFRKTGQTLLALTVRVPPKSKTGVMKLHLPHTLYLPDGVTMQVDKDKKEKHQIQTCNHLGCYVGFPIKKALLQKMKTGKSINIAFKGLNKKEIKIGLPLQGFDKAYEKIKQ